MNSGVADAEHGKPYEEPPPGGAGLRKEKRMKEITRERVVYALSAKDEPVARIRAGETVRVQTYDCYGGHLLPEGNTFADHDRRFGNPATGPIFVEGAEPGDMLKIEIEKIELGPVGILDVGPGSGALSGIFSESVINRLPVLGDQLRYKGLSLPVHKMIGVIGTAPAGKPVSTMTPMDHGGNMDCKRIEEGATLYLPVFVRGGLLSLGDFHAIMADGEVANCGLEIEGRAQLGVDVVKCAGLAFPMLENRGQWITIAWGDTLDEASEKAARQMFRFLTEKQDLAPDDAAMLIDMAGELRVCQIVNPKKTARMEVSKEWIAAFRSLGGGKGVLPLT